MHLRALLAAVALQIMIVSTGIKAATSNNMRIRLKKEQIFRYSQFPDYPLEILISLSRKRYWNLWEFASVRMSLSRRS